MPEVKDAQAEVAPAWATQLLERIDRIEADQKAVKARTVGFKPMQSSAPRPKGMKAQLANMQSGEQREGVSKQILVDIHGEKLTQSMINQHPPQFAAGDPVQINPESVRNGFPEGQTWGDLLAKHQSTGYGVVKKVYWINDDYEWKYSCVIPGITNGRPDGFHDSELLPA